MTRRNGKKFNKASCAVAAAAAGCFSAASNNVKRWLCSREQPVPAASSSFYPFTPIAVCTLRFLFFPLHNRIKRPIFSLRRRNLFRAIRGDNFSLPFHPPLALYTMGSLKFAHKLHSVGRLHFNPQNLVPGAREFGNKLRKKDFLMRDYLRLSDFTLRTPESTIIWRFNGTAFEVVCPSLCACTAATFLDLTRVERQWFWHDAAEQSLPTCNLHLLSRSLACYARWRKNKIKRRQSAREAKLSQPAHCDAKLVRPRVIRIFIICWHTACYSN